MKKYFISYLESDYDSMDGETSYYSRNIIIEFNFKVLGLEALKNKIKDLTKHNVSAIKSINKL